MYILCVYAIMAPAHESETIVFNFLKLLSTLPNYAELEQILLFSVNWSKQVCFMRVMSKWYRSSKWQRKWQRILVYFSHNLYIFEPCKISEDNFISNIFFGVWFMVFNATFNNISVISWRSVLLVVETGVPGENH